MLSGRNGKTGFSRESAQKNLSLFYWWKTAPLQPIKKLCDKQVPAMKNRSPGRNTFPQKERFLLFLTSDTVTTIYSNMKKNAAKNSRLETESHLICAPSTQSDDRRQVHPPRWSWGGKTRSWQPFRVRPLYDDILSACRTTWRGSWQKTGTTQHIKDPLTADRVKCFILTESRSGYSIRFSIWASFSHPVWALDCMFTWTLFIPVLDPTSIKSGACGPYMGRDAPEGGGKCSHQNMWMNICQVVSFVTGTGDPSTVTDTDADHQ